MSQARATGSRRSDHGHGSPPAPVVAFDPQGEIVARDHRAATRAAIAEDFAVRFGLEDVESSADALADRYGFRYEQPEVGAPVRRTVTITGRGADRVIAPRSRAQEVRRAAPRRRADTIVFRGDRIAMWAVLLGLLLMIVAATSGHATMVH